MFLESADARCPKRPGPWWWPFQKLHRPNPNTVRVSPWGARNWLLYEVALTCSDCGARVRRFGVTETELVAIGATPPEQESEHE
jgi:hypothetical protein